MTKISMDQMSIVDFSWRWGHNIMFMLNPIYTDWSQLDDISDHPDLPDSDHDGWGYLHLT